MTADQLDLFTTPGKVGRDHPATATDAATRGRFRFGTQRHQVLAALTRGDATAHTVAQRVGLTPNQCATRLLELREAGLVDFVRDDTGQVVTAPTTGGFRGQVQCITAEGRGVLWQLQAAR